MSSRTDPQEHKIAPKWKTGPSTTSPKALRAAFLTDPKAAPLLPLSGYRAGELVRLRGSSAEFIVTGETTVTRPDEILVVIGLWGGKDGDTGFRSVMPSAVADRVRKPKTKHGAARD